MMINNKINNKNKININKIKMNKIIMIRRIMANKIIKKMHKTNQILMEINLK